MSQESIPATLIDAALQYAARGWHVFPLHWPVEGECSCNNTDCQNQAKHPLTANGFKDATTDPALIQDWWHRWPKANIGIATGAVSNIVVIDIDSQGAKDDLEKILPADYDFDFVARSITGRGWHLVFLHPGTEVKNRTGVLPKVDVRCDGGYFVVEPSIHITGTKYEWQVQPGDELQELPVNLYQLISTPSSNGNGYKPPLDIRGVFDGIPEGQRDDTLFRALCKIRGIGMPEDFARQYALEAARNCSPPFPERVVIDKVGRIYSNPQYLPRNSSNGANASTVPSWEQVTFQGSKYSSLSVPCSQDIPEETPEDANIIDDPGKFPEAAWTGLFGTWREVIGPCTEAAVEFLWAGVLLAAGLLIGRRAWRKSPRPIYPNFYILLIGPSGDSRKSTVIWFIRRLLETVGDTDIKYLPGIISSEGIIEALAQKEETKCLAIADEFRSLLIVSQRKGTANIIPTLNSLYYCPNEEAVDRVKDPSVAIKPFLSLVTATPLAFVDGLLGEAEIAGGFLNRFVCVAPLAEQPPNAMPDEPTAEQWERLRAPLRELDRRLDQRPQQQMPFTPDGEKMFIEFYNTLYTYRRGTDYRTASLTARGWEHVLKIALVYSLLANEAAISKKSVSIAIAVTRWLQGNTLKLFGSIGLDTFGKAEAAILEIIRARPNKSMYRRDLQQAAFKKRINGELFNRAMKTLETNEHINVAPVLIGGRKRVVVEYLSQLKSQPQSAAETKASSEDVLSREHGTDNPADYKAQSVTCSREGTPAGIV